MGREAIVGENATYDFLEAHVAEVTWHVARSVRGIVPFSQLTEVLVQVLLDNAVAVSAPVTGVMVDDTHPWRHPDAEFLEDSRIGPIIEALLQDERLWLQEHESLWPWYGGAVIRVLSRDRTRWENLSSRSLEQVVMATTKALISRDRAPLSLLDPVCGSGTLLAAAAAVLDGDVRRICGQDINPNVLAVAQRVLALGGGPADLRTDDLMITDAFPGDTFDLVVMDPPMGALADRGLRGQPAAESVGSRLVASLPPIRHQEWRTLALALDKVSPEEKGGGTLVAFLTSGALLRQGPDVLALRGWIHQQDLLKAIIALPQGVRTGTGVGTYALVLSTAMGKGFVNKTQVIDLRGSFDTTLNSAHGRRITPAGQSEMASALATSKPSRHVRTVAREQLEMERFRYVVPHVSTILDGRSADSAAFERDLPLESTGWEWPLDEERDGTSVRFRRQPERLVDWSVDRFVKSRSSQRMQTAWAMAPLLTLAKHVEYRRSVSALDRDALSPWLPDVQVLALPLAGSASIAFGALSEIVPDERSILLELSDGVDGEFLVSWLSSDEGVESRNIAYQNAFGREGPGRAVSGSAAVALLVHLLVPIPTAKERDELLEVHDLIEAARRSLDGMSRELWATREGHEGIIAKLRSFNEGEGLAHWSESLPYPIASALRTAQSLEHDPAAHATQIIHFWEASAQFLATYLLSGVRGSEELWQKEIPSIRTILASQGNSFERASFGTWKVTIERLTTMFGELLSSTDVDEQQRVLELLGDPPVSVRDSLLDGRLSKWVSSIATTRNTLHGHAASMTSQQLAATVRGLDAHTDELRSILGHVWRDFPLVRPHAQSMGFRGGRFYVTVDQLVGPTSPFLPKTLELDEALEDGELYLMGARGAVKLLPFVKIGRAPRDPGDTPLFYNRRTAEGVRMVAYTFAAEADITESDPGLQLLLDDIAHREVANEPGLTDFDS